MLERAWASAARLIVARRRWQVLLLVIATAVVALVAQLPGAAAAPPTSTTALGAWCANQSKVVILGDSTTTGYGTRCAADQAPVRTARRS